MRVLKVKELLSILFFLIFPNLIFGPAIPDILISLIGIIGLIYIFLNKELEVINNKYFYIFILWYLFLLLSSFLSTNPFYSLESSLFYFRFFIFSLIIVFLINKSSIIKKYLFLILSLTFLFILTISLLQFFIDDLKISFLAQPDFKQVKDTFHQRLQGPFFQSILGGFLIKFLPLVILSYFYVNNFKFKRVILFSILFFSIFVIFLTGERSAFVLVIVFLFLLLFNKSISIKIKLAMFPLILLLYLAAFYFLPSLLFRIVFTLNQFNFLNHENIILSNIYFKYFYNAYSIFLDNYLLGSGPKMFRVLCSDYLLNIPNSCSTHPHNIYFQLMSETGIIGFFFVFSLFIYLLYKLITLKNNEYSIYNVYFFSYLGVILYLWPFTTSNSFFNNYANIVLFIYVAFVINTLKDPKNVQ